MGSCYIYKYITKKWISLDLCLLTSSDVHAILPTEQKLESTIWVLIIFQLNIELLYMKILMCEKGKVFEGIATAVNTGYMMMMGRERGQAG